MKAAKYLFFLTLCIPILLLSSCKDDSEDAIPKNNFKIDDKYYELTKGYLEDFEENFDGSFDFDVTLVSSGLSYNRTASGGSFAGTGDLVYLDLNTSSSAGLVVGTYTYSDGDRAANNFVDAIVAVGFVGATEQATYYEANGGSVVISKVDGNNVIITFNLTFSNGKTCTGTYNGSLQ